MRQKNNSKRFLVLMMFFGFWSLFLAQEKMIVKILNRELKKEVKNLKEMHVSSVKYEYSEYSEMNRDHILEEIIKLEEILPNCIFYVDHNIYQ